MVTMEVFLRLFFMGTRLSVHDLTITFDHLTELPVLFQHPPLGWINAKAPDGLFLVVEAPVEGILTVEPSQPVTMGQAPLLSVFMASFSF